MTLTAHNMLPVSGAPGAGAFFAGRGGRAFPLPGGTLDKGGENGYNNSQVID